jgi:hypothetical protein
MAYQSDEEQQLQLAIQQSLQDIATQMGEPISLEAATQLYQEATALLGHLDYAPITLARVAGTLLVFQSQTEPEEMAWFKSQLQEASDSEAVEELIESMNRTDAL